MCVMSQWQNLIPFCAHLKTGLRLRDANKCKGLAQVALWAQEDDVFGVSCEGQGLCRVHSHFIYEKIRTGHSVVCFEDYMEHVKLNQPPNMTKENKINHAQCTDEPNDLILDRQPSETTVEEEEKLRRKVFVRRISFKAREVDVWEFFMKFGQVVNCFMPVHPLTRIHKRYAFITFATEEEAEFAKAAPADEQILFGMALGIHAAYPRKPNTGFLELWIPETCSAGNDMVNKRKCLSSKPVEQILPFANNKKCIDDLNDDCLQQLLSYLSLRERLGIERVCVRWRKIALELWKQEKHLDFRLIFGQWEGPHFTWSRYKMILEKCNKRLVGLKLCSKMVNFDVRCTELMASWCPNLKTLDVGGLKIMKKGLIAVSKKCVGLQNVNFHNCSTVGEKGLWWLMHCCRQLRTLDLSSNFLFTGMCFHHIAPTLTTLKMLECKKLSPAGFALLVKNCPQMKQLYLSGNSRLTEQSIQLMCNSMKSLEVLWLKGKMPCVGPAALQSLSYLQSLKELNLASNKAVCDRVLKSIAESCQLLEKLNISECDGNEMLTDTGIGHLGMLPRLTHLKMNYLKDATGAGLDLVANRQQLRVLEAHGCICFCQIWLKSLMEMCPFLEEIDVSGCSLLSGDEVVAKALGTTMFREKGVTLQLILGGTIITKDYSTLDNDLVKISKETRCTDHVPLWFNELIFEDNLLFEEEEDDDLDLEDEVDIWEEEMHEGWS